MPLRHLVALPLVVLAAAGCRSIEPLPEPGPDPHPALTAARVTLGQRLFFDPALSADGTVSCASCHAPAHAGADPRPTSTGVGGAAGRRNAPSVFSAALKTRQFWDGRAATLEEQALGPLMSPDEMGMTPEAVLAVLREPRYADAFAAAFPDAPEASLDGAARAIATYERALPTPTPVDAFLRGDSDALDATERAGYALFTEHCDFCHDGAGVGGQRFERLGQERPWPAERSDDLGRMEVTGRGDDRLVFMVPSLRHVGRTAPYFHDGSVETLEEAVRLMGTYQVGVEFTDPQVEQLVAFLRALDADPDQALLVAPPAP